MKSVFVGYVENLKAYRLLHLSSNIVLESRILIPLWVVLKGLKVVHQVNKERVKG